MSAARWKALLALGVIEILSSIAFVAELVHSKFVQGPVQANYVTVLFAIGVSSIAVGTLVARAQPAVGVLLVAAAAGGYWRFSTHPWLAVAGFAIAYCTPLFVLHAAAIYGEGTRAVRHGVLIAFEAAVAAIGLAVLATAAPGVIDRWFVAADPRRHVANHVLLIDAHSVAKAAHACWWVALIAGGTVFTGMRLRSWRGAPRAVRVREAPVVWAMAGWTVCAGAGAGALFLHRTTSSGVSQQLADYGAIMLPAVGLGLVGAAIAWVELVRPRLGQVHPGRIDLHTIEPQDTDALRRLLADVLATSKVDVVFHVDQGWVDDTGRPVDLPDEQGRMTTIRRQGTPIAAVIHDPDVSNEAVELAARLVGGHIDAQASSAWARARTEAVRAAAGQLVRAGDRAAIALSEHLAEPIAALETLTLRLVSDPATLPTCSAVLREITADVRRISHGVYPRGIEDGLSAVMHQPGTPTRRLPPAIEMTLYLLARDGAQLADHDAYIEVTRTAPIPDDLAERVNALGGHIDGTVARIPLGTP